jgi:hypothetical protein
MGISWYGDGVSDNKGLLCPVETVHTIGGGLGGNVTILGKDILGNCKKISSYEHVSYSEWLPR